MKKERVSGRKRAGERGRKSGRAGEREKKSGRAGEWSFTFFQIWDLRFEKI
jgi:hypothetical protein